MSEPADKYYYSQEEDYNRIKIRFAPSRDFPFEVAAKSAKLDRILLFSGMTEYFTVKERALTFAPNEYIMSPALFNNIYKGALGEAAGWVWFRNVLGIKLDMIREPAMFELFEQGSFRFLASSQSGADADGLVIVRVGRYGKAGFIGIGFYHGFGGGRLQNIVVA